MRTRGQERPGALEWTSFPAEIRLMILSTIAHQKYPGWASHASVCKEWQYVLEKANFYEMKLSVACLDDLESKVSLQKRELIHHIYLNVKLPRYTSTCCSKRRSPSIKVSSIVSNGIWKLFSILSTWRPATHLALEINVSSPSDSEHWFKNLSLFSNDLNHDIDEIPVAGKGMMPHHDLQHGWEHGQRVKAPPRSAVLRLYRPIRLVFHGLLPRVKAVTCLIIRRQLRRCISPLGLGLLLSSLHGVEHISYEPWAPYEAANREFHNRGAPPHLWKGQVSHSPNILHPDHLSLSYGIGLGHIMQNCLPDTLKELIIFEDAYRFYDPFPKRPGHIPWFNLVDPSKGLSAVFAIKSLGLQHLAISFMINAEELFQHCQSTWSWSNLRSLALTSQLLQNDGENHKQIDALLCRASFLVQKMARLHTFVLWNGGKAHACAFIYRIDRDSASITWRGTWHLELSPVIVKSWQLAASKLPSSDLQIKQEFVRGVIRSHGDAIYHLDLPCQVIDPASLWQIQREGWCLEQ